MPFFRPTILLLAGVLCWSAIGRGGELTRVSYNHPGLVVDLGVGLWAWPLPMDFDRDGDLDLVVVCPDVPFNGTYFFENPGTGGTQPIFRPPIRLGRGMQNLQISYVDGQPRVLAPGREFADFRGKTLSSPQELGIPGKLHPGRTRANQWKYCDYDADGVLDLMVGVGDWTDYGWDDAYDADGTWSNGPLHGYVYVIRNRGTNGQPSYAAPSRLQVDGKPIDVYGMPSPNLADFDGDGDLDLICGEFLDGFTYFENVGSRTEPIWSAGQRLRHGDQPLRMDLQMITPTAIDWDADGDIDLIVGDEDGRVAFVEHVGLSAQRVPQFAAPVYFQQEAAALKFGALVTPVSVDWDEDGDEDLICGNTAGYIGYLENLDGGNPPRWAAPVRLQAGGEVIRIQAGRNGSIQGPCEAKWGYTTLSVADWDHDGRADILANSIWGRVVWFRNMGNPGRPELAPAQAVRYDAERPNRKPAWNWWDPEPGELVTQWRTTPLAVDWNEDGLTDLVLLDSEGYLCLAKRRRSGGKLELGPPERVFSGFAQHSYDARHAGEADGDGQLRLNINRAGGSGRRKFCVVDWDGDGRRDLLVNSRSVNFLRNVTTKEAEQTWFRDRGPLTQQRLAGHTTSPTTVDWDGDGVRDLLLGAEDGMFYWMRNVQRAPRPADTR